MMSVEPTRFPEAGTDEARLNEPGIAFNTSRKLITEGKIEEARKLKPYMVSSDQIVIERRISELGGGA
jgi:hypothetical protein